MLGAVVKTKINRCLFWKTTPALEVRSGRIALREGPQNGRYQTPKRRSRIGIHVHMTLTSFTSHHVLSCLRTVFTFRDSQDDSPFIDATRSITRCSVRRTLSSSLISIRSSLMAARSARAAARSTVRCAFCTTACRLPSGLRQQPRGGTAPSQLHSFPSSGPPITRGVGPVGRRNGAAQLIVGSALMASRSAATVAETGS